MARLALLCCGLLAACVVASASDIWPVGVKDVDDEFTTQQATLAAAEYHKGYKKRHDHAYDPDHGYDGGMWDGQPEEVHSVYDTNKKHLGPCIGSRMVSVTPTGNGTLNPQCPPAPNPAVENCTVPAFCPAVVPCPNPAPCPALEWKRFASDQVAAHFQNQPGPFPMADVRHSTYECVDARGSDPMLGTPGGDLAETMAFAMTAMKLLGTTYNQDIADDVFEEFIEKVAEPDRPLYFHTDDASLRRMFVYLDSRTPGPQPSIFPYEAPGAQTNTWLQALVKPEFNGCGHIRLQLVPELEDLYSLKVNGAVANCVGSAAPCVKATPIAQRIIEKYFRYWWPTPPGSIQRAKVAFGIDGILVGPLLGKAVTVISNSPEDACPHHAPLVRPAFGASKVFVYHGEAIAKWREWVVYNPLRSYLLNLGLDLDAFLTTWNGVTGQQLGATLTWLTPANSIGVFGVGVPVRDVSDDYKGKY